MAKASVIKLSIIVFLIFILCLPEFFPNGCQIHFLCELFDPCKAVNGSGDPVQVCHQTGPQCSTEMTHTSDQDRQGRRYMCKTQMPLHLVTSASGEHVMVVLTLKGHDLSERNISMHAFLNHTDLYTGPYDNQTLFYCYIQPDRSKCHDMNMATEEHTHIKGSFQRPNTVDVKTTTSAKPDTSSLKPTELSSQVTTSSPEHNCQPTSSTYLFHYQEDNQTERSAALPLTQKKQESWWCWITVVWLALVLTVFLMALLSVGCLIFKSRRLHRRRSDLAAFVQLLSRDYQSNKINQQRENLMSKTPDVSIDIRNMDDNKVFPEIVSMGSRTEETLLKVDAVKYKRRLSPIYEVTETSLNEEDHEEDKEEEECYDEFKESMTV